MKLALAGLGKMGAQIARKLAEDGHEVIAYDVSEGASTALAALKIQGITVATSKEHVVEAFSGEQFVLWLMIPSDFVGQEIEEWVKLMPKGSTIVDGGNSDYRLTRERAKQIEAAGLHMLDSGTSGGVWGYDNGFSLMVGGNEEAFRAIEPIFRTLSLPHGAFHFFGESGSGHFVKMTHNAVEYGMMESLAEGYRLLKEGPFPKIELAAAGEVWQHGSVVVSWLNELSRQALNENPELSGIDGFVAESGEARWALETAKELDMPLPAIQSAFDVRLASRKGDINFATKMLAAMRNKFGGHDINNTKNNSNK
jgi:6-phosphogluconate dehydrogenase